MSTKGTYRPRRNRNLVPLQRGTKVIPNANTGMKRGGQCSPDAPPSPNNKLKVTFNSMPNTAHRTSHTKTVSSAHTPPSVPNSSKGASAAIPLPSTHIPRTKSELQLTEDTAAAEWADMCMFHRLVTGIRERQHRLLESEQQAQMATIREQRQDRRVNAHLLDHNSRPRMVRPAPTMQTERCIDSIISTRQGRVVSAEDIGTSATKNESAQATSRHRDRRSPAAGQEDWSLEGYDNKDDGEQDPQDDDQDDKEDDGGIFSLDL